MWHKYPEEKPEECKEIKDAYAVNIQDEAGNFRTTWGEYVDGVWRYPFELHKYSGGGIDFTKLPRERVVGWINLKDFGNVIGVVGDFEGINGMDCVTPNNWLFRVEKYKETQNGQ